jgi:hypothetical protein
MTCGSNRIVNSANAGVNGHRSLGNQTSLIEVVMLSSFISWARQVEASSIGVAVETRITESGASDNPSARLDIDTPTVVARVTCWKSGDYDTEVIDLETERTLYSSHGILQRGQNLFEEFSAYFEAVGITVK